MSNSLNSYLLILKNCVTKQIWTFTLQNQSSNNLYYEFDFEMPEDCPSGEYNYYLFWNTYDNITINYNGDTLDSIITLPNGQQLKLSDVFPETGIIKYIKNIKDTETSLEYEKKTHFLVYE